MDVTSAIENEVDLLQNKLKDTLKEEEERGASARGLGTRAERLEERAGMFQSTAHDVRNKLWWKNFKWMVAAVILAVLLGLVLYKTLLK